MTNRLPLLILLSAAAMPAFARPPGMWGTGFGSGLGNASLADRWDAPRGRSGPDSREGKVDADSFVAAQARAQLGQGRITVAAPSGSADEAGDRPAYEAAVIDQLVKAGYDTATPDPEGGQLVELRIARETLVPEEAKRKPVSGAADIGISNRGTSYGLAIAVDLGKPKKALLSTRLEARIRDRASGATLWEGRATIATRAGDGDWTDQAIATRLAAALFADFPNGSATRVAAR